MPDTTPETTPETVPSTNSAQVGAGSLAPEPKQTDYYTIKVPTFGTALKQLWKGGKFLSKKMEPIANKALDKVVDGIATVAGLPDPKTGTKPVVKEASTKKTKEQTEEQTKEKPAAETASVV